MKQHSLMIALLALVVAVGAAVMPMTLQDKGSESELAALRQDVTNLRAELQRRQAVQHNLAPNENALVALEQRLEELYLVTLAREEEETRHAPLLTTETFPTGEGESGAAMTAISIDEDALVARLEDRLRGSGGFAMATDEEWDPREPVTVTEQEKEKVKVALDQIREEEEQARQERQEERRQERLTERMEELATELTLQPYQVSEMTNLYNARDTRRSELFQQMREGDFDRDEMREVMRTAQTEFDTQLEQVLDPFQYEKYQELQSEQNNRRGGRRGNLRGGGGGGGGGQNGSGGPTN